jgi:hypothetical protein
MEREVIKIDMMCVDIEGPPQIIVQKRKIEMVAGTKDNAIELLGAPVHEPHPPAIHGLDPWFYRDTSFGDKQQKVLAHRYAGFKDVIGRSGRPKLLRVPSDGEHELLEPCVHSSHGKPLFTKRRETGKRDMVQRHPIHQLWQDIALPAIRHNHAGSAKTCQVARNLNRTNRAPSNQHPQTPILFRTLVRKSMVGAGRP